MCRLVLSQWLPRERPRAWQLVSCIGGGGNAAGTTAALLFLVALAYMPWQAEATAGPLADAVARAKAAAGLAKPPPQEPPGHPPQQFQAVPQLPPRAAQEVVGADVRNDRPAVVSLAVRLPIVGNRDVQLRAAILRQLDQLTSQPGQRGVLVLQFETANVEAAAASDFGRSLALARFLTDPQLAGVKTVAFLPAGASGHAVLVALACDEIVMSPDAVLGPANADEPRIDEAMRVAYREVASRRRTVQPPLAVALLDPSASVLRVVTEVGEQIIPADRLPALRRELQVLKVEELGPIPLTLTGRQGRELGVVRLLARNAADLAKALAIDPARLLVDPSLERGWQAAAVSLSGPVAGMAVARLQSQLDEALLWGPAR